VCSSDLIPDINKVVFEQLVKDGIIKGGMIPKLKNAFDAIEKGVKEVIITSAGQINGESGTKVTE
jgi:acetylglutamate kinase